jgi:hypothetical protein
MRGFSICGGPGDLILFSPKRIEEGAVKISGNREDLSVLAPDEGAVRIRAKLKKGHSIYVSEKVDMDLNGKVVIFSYSVSRPNKSESDYRIGKARYPFFIQFVFDRGPDLSLRKKLVLWYKSLSEKKVKTKRNIIYAFTNRMPSGSIATPLAGSAVISVGDERDAGRIVKVSRVPSEDYRLAFGEKLSGRVKKIVLGFEGDKNLEGELEVRFSGIKISDEGG